MCISVPPVEPHNFESSLVSTFSLSSCRLCLIPVTLLHAPYRLRCEGSQAFKSSHVQSKIGDFVLERPQPGMYDAVIIEPVPPEHKGGLWDFENEPSYFDGDL